jgi:hypothetical protein
VDAHAPRVARAPAKRSGGTDLWESRYSFGGLTTKDSRVRRRALGWRLRAHKPISELKKSNY